MANEMDSILWVKELVYETEVLSHEYVRKLCKIMHDCGMDETMKQEWVSEFKERITGWYERLILDAEDAKNEVVHTIEELLRKAEGLCRQLQIQMPCYGSKKLSLFEERRYLLSTIAKYEEKIQSRKKEISDMITREEVACRSLGVEPKPLPDDPLPSQADLLNFEERIALLEDKKLKREERFLKLKGDIIDVVEKLKIKPSLELEKIVVSPNNSLFMVTDGNMEWVESYYLSLIAEYEKRELVKLLEKREQLLSQIHELNEKPATKERLKNRGGQLLREEMERKTLSKTLSQMETNLLKLADEFELRTGSKFRSSGETIHQIIKNSNMDKEMKKQQKLNARNEVKKALSPGRIGLCLGSIYSSQQNLAVLTPLRKTPGTKSAKHTPLATSKRKLVIQLSSGGKRTKNNTRAIGVSPIAPQ